MKYKNLEKDFKELPNSKIIKKAWEFAKLAHTGQKRLSGSPYIVHPLGVAKRLAGWKLDSTSIIAGLLHDTIEDGGARREDLVEEFGEEVATLVDGVTKITSLRLKGSYEEAFVENLRKMLLVMAKDLRVVFVKLADRLNNLETLWALSSESQKENANETLEIYAPLAERLGMGKVKGELEDLSFPYAYPDEYKKVVKDSESFYKKAEEHILEMKKVIHKGLLKEKVRAGVHGRKKHLYSLWRKLQRPEIDGDFDKVNDIAALRILVDTIAQCYIALGVVHKYFKPVPHIGISDFIAQPKPNGYRSIHTKVFGPAGRIVEVQIRTHEMHKEAELGIAAHWAYKEGASVTPDKLLWVKNLVNWQKEISDSQEFLKAVKFDALKHRNFVFSPNGDVYDLPADATPIDFAYAVHTGLGNFIGGAKVNGKMVPLNYKLKSGEVVEIIKSKNWKVPSHSWLEFVVTTEARRQINKQLRKQ